MLSILLAAFAVGHSAANSEPARDLPAHFVANRVFVEPSLANGKTIRFYTDTGGGANLLCRDAATRLGLELRPFSDPESESELGKDLAKTDFPIFRDGRGIPANASGDAELLVHNCEATPGWPDDAWGEGFLSSRWFEGRIWTWDYPNGKLRLEGTKFQSGETARPLELGFKTDKSGKRTFAMARIVVTVDGQPLDMLFDTGATTLLTPAASAKANDDLPALRATSFVVRSRIDEWHKRHPEWRIIDDAEVGTHARMIEVPNVRIAEFEAGPTWFTERPDANFRQWMAQMMDKPTDGAIGGNALSHFVVTVDYPNAIAYVRCTKDCPDPISKLRSP